MKSIRLFPIIVAVLLMIGLQYLVRRTSLGRAMRAVAIDREAAAMMGVNVDRVIMATFFIGSALAGAGGVLTGMAKRTVDGARTISIATPEELDKLLEWVNAGSPLVSQHEGEHLFASERLVVSPAAGVFTPVDDLADGCRIEVGTVLGHVGDAEVRSPFAGLLQSYIAVEGERVTLRQPIAWLRTV